MQLVVNDTSIFIDLMRVHLLEKFFQFPIEAHTTDFIIKEIDFDK